ncbi:MAG: serine hydrolase [Fusobacteriaceae bacterium]|jgi:predicted alpha/beta hydrolase family esterase|nr:putative hydrolase [Fusobacteriales bacterium]MDN5303592.1 serine hydrolase [Fusobacteriaceae bacterium]
MKKTYIIIHGLNGSPKGHWQHWLYEKLKNNNENVIFPQFLNNSKPDLKVWLKTLHTTLQNIHNEKIIICHSLGVILWFHYSMKYNIENVKYLLLVAPPGTEALKNIKELNSFKEIKLNKNQILNSAKHIRLVATENDEYCKEGAINLYAKKLNIDYDILPPEKGHINIETGYGEWKSVYAWCYNQEIRIKE